MNSLVFWASDDGTGLQMSDAQKDIETRYMKSKLEDLEKGLDKAVEECVQDINKVLEVIFANFGVASQQAASLALPTAQRWGSPENKVCSSLILATCY
jgi:hypothetical protein